MAGSMSEKLDDNEIKLLKLLINKPSVIRMIADYPRAIVKDGLYDWSNKVCKFYGISLGQLVGKKRDRYIVKARRDFCHLTKDNSINCISRFLKRHHTVVKYYLKKPPHNIDKINGE